MRIREATQTDFEKIWPFFKAIAAAGETYAYPRDITRQDAEKRWMELTRKTYVAETGGEVMGTYYIKTNHEGPGSHVCNCGYMVPSNARNRGIGEAMCRHSQKTALRLGYKAMQFNFVAESNTGAVRLWRKLGFETVGRLPMAFNHPCKGYIDALVMYKWLKK